MDLVRSKSIKSPIDLIRLSTGSTGSLLMVEGTCVGKLVFGMKNQKEKWGTYTRQNFGDQVYSVGNQVGDAGASQMPYSSFFPLITW